MSKGLLISFEGMEGAGKTTQCNLLAKRLKKLGKKVVVLREPGGVPISEQIREVVLRPSNTAMANTTEVLLFHVARAQIYDEIVLPSLKKGEVVIMDRTRDSSTIYQGMVRGMGEKWIETLNDYSTQNTVPDFTFLLDLPAQKGMDRRISQGKLDRIEREGVGLQRRVCKAYLDFSKRDKSGRWQIIDGKKSIEEIAEEVWEKTQEWLNSN